MRGRSAQKSAGDDIQATPAKTNNLEPKQTKHWQSSYFVSGLSDGFSATIFAGFFPFFTLSSSVTSPIL